MAKTGNITVHRNGKTFQRKRPQYGFSGARFKAGVKKAAKNTFTPRKTIYVSRPQLTLSERTTKKQARNHAIKGMLWAEGGGLVMGSAQRGVSRNVQRTGKLSGSDVTRLTSASIVKYDIDRHARTHDKKSQELSNQVRLSSLERQLKRQHGVDAKLKHNWLGNPGYKRGSQKYKVRVSNRKAPLKGRPQKRRKR